MSSEVKKDKNIHTSVLYNELVDAVWENIENQQTPRIVVDGTLGYAGHALGIINKMEKTDIFVGFDADKRNLELAKQRIQKEQNENFPTILLVNSNFLDLKRELKKNNIEKIDALYLDLGVSSIHFDEASRGFSFRMDAPLDMRFDASSGETAADILNSRSESELADIFYYYGEERASKKIANIIVKQRKIKPIKMSSDLNQILDLIHPNIKLKTKIYQALRIAVNKELENLETCLEDAIEILNENGILFVISFHSLEDRIVKNILKKYSKDCVCSDIICSCTHKKSIKILTKKPIVPSTIEQKENPRSRSAKARIGKKYNY